MLFHACQFTATALSCNNAVAIPEFEPVHPGTEKPFSALSPVLSSFGIELPKRLRLQNMHLDPDFKHFTYGDVNQRVKQLESLTAGDTIVFYAGLSDVRNGGALLYAIIGLYVVDKITSAASIRKKDRDINAHSRRVLTPGAADLVVHGRPGVSGRLKRCLPIGDYRDGAYRVRQDLLDEWGGLSVKDGYIQRSARLPRFMDPKRFHAWLAKQRPALMQSNN